ncbi:hypothetical protein L6386_04685 [bacterium]|nr:hypothetical protein [bacterium]MCG2677835.1 hypothetical protein [bacterium]
MRKLIYVPIIHTEADMGSLAGSLKEEYLKKFGKGRWQKQKGAVRDMWQGIKEKLKSLKLNYKKVRIYQDGLPVCGREKEKEIVRKVARAGSTNHGIILDLAEKGAKIEGTESAELLLKEYGCLRNIAQARELAKQERAIKRYEEAGRELLTKRDAYIAKRIDETLKEGETGILFMGIKHEVDKYLPKDIEISYLIHRLPFTRAYKPGGE